MTPAEDGLESLQSDPTKRYCLSSDKSNEQPKRTSEMEPGDK